jgi:WD40 repeat protein/serine/threonine protein kinase
MTASSDQRNPVEALAEEFLDRKRRGETPTLREFLERYPDLADEIRDLFPALLMMEDLGEDSGGKTGSQAADGAVAIAERLQKLGDFRILREIGRGGMGVVYEAEQESLGRRVALKILPQQVGRDAKVLERFRREARAAARLHHTNIVPVFDVGHEGETYYYAMQFIQGHGLDLVYNDLRRLRGIPRAKGSVLGDKGAVADSMAATSLGTDRQYRTAVSELVHSLLTGRFQPGGTETPGGGEGSVTDALLSPPPPAPPLQAVSFSSPGSAVLPGGAQLSTVESRQRQYARSIARIGHQVAGALAYAHQRGVIHRDIKPSNLLLDTAGVTWITDFGLAKADDIALTQTGDILGTIRYMAPERFRGESDGRADIYSLGLTLYELLTLAPAFDASDRLRLIEQVQSEEPIRPRLHDRRIPRDLETILLKAIDKDPGRRYQTAEALEEDLRRFLDDEPILARRVSPAERALRWCRRNPWLASAVATAATALVATAVISTIYGVQQALSRQRITGLAQRLDAESRNLQSERANLRSALGESSRRMAMLHYERGQTACEQGDIGMGLLYFVASWRAAVDAGDQNAAWLARMSLAAWRPHYPTLKGVVSPQGVLSWLACGPSGKVVAVGKDDNSVQMWDAVSGRPFGPQLRHRSPVLWAAFSPDGKTILTHCSDGSWWSWDIATGQPAGPHSRSQRDAIGDMALDPEHRVLVPIKYGEEVRLRTPSTGQSIVLPAARLGSYDVVAVAPDGKTLLTGGGVYGKAGEARLLDTATGKLVGLPLRHRSEVFLVTFSPDGKTALTADEGGDFMVHLWDVTTAKPLGLALPHRDDVYTMAFSLDGKTVLTSSADQTSRLWGFSPGEPVGLPLLGAKACTGAGFDLEGNVILTTTDDGPARLWDSATGQRLDKELPIRSVRPAPRWTRLDSSQAGTKILTLASVSTAQLWDLTTQGRVGAEIEHQGPISALALSPDGKTILTGGPDKVAWLWDAESGKRLGPPLRHQGAVYCAAFSPDGSALLTGGGDNTARLWDTASGQPTGLTFSHRKTVCAVAFSPDGQIILTAGFDNTARLWDRRTGKPIGSVIEHRSAIYCVAISPDGKIVLTGGLLEAARLWDAHTGKAIGPWLAHESTVNQVAFRSDGRAFLTRSDLVRIWQVPELADDLPRASAWVEALTGMELDEQGNSRLLDSEAWHQKCALLESLGGSPELRAVPLRDPILYGPDPPARARALMERQLWDQAEAALDEVLATWPKVGSFWFERGQFYLGRAQPEKAAADFTRAYILGDRSPALLERISSGEAHFHRVVAESAGSAAPLWAYRGESLAQRRQWSEAAAAIGEAVRLRPEDFIYDHYDDRHRQILALLAAGDRARLRCAISELLERFQGTTHPPTANSVAWLCVLGPDAVADHEVPVRLAEIAVQGATADADRLNTLGAGLYRAGRFAAAIDRLEEAVRLQGGVGLPKIWAFLAMAHHGLGQRDEARRWLVRLREHRPSTRPAQFWNELETRLLRSEAEALIVGDAAFPADPFTR